MFLGKMRANLEANGWTTQSGNALSLGNSLPIPGTPSRTGSEDVGKARHLHLLLGVRFCSLLLDGGTSHDPQKLDRNPE
jgi:hypothetical protein